MESLSKLYFSYGQFMVYDGSVDLPGCDWTEAHSDQGFARRESTVGFGTPLEFGFAEVSFVLGPFEPKRPYSRIVAVPFRCASGTVSIEGPEEWPISRSVTIPPGDYRLIAAQTIVREDEEVIDLFMEPVSEPLDVSTIFLADEFMNPPAQLIETARVAGDQ